MRRVATSKKSVKTAAVARRMNKNAMPATKKLAARAANKNKTTPPTEIDMSIDLGSSGVRTCIWNPDVAEGRVGRDPVIMILNIEDGGDGYTFSASGAVMDDDTPDEDIYIENLGPDARLGGPLKYGLYILSDAKEELTKDYHLMKDLLQEDRRNKDEFRRKLRLGLVQMFTKLKGRVDKVIEAREKNWKVGKLGITIPSQWTLDFEDQYREVLAEVFDWNVAQARRRIAFIFEPEGLAAYLLHRREYEDDDIAQSSPNEHRMVLCLDFGGHSMNGSLYWINAKRGEVLSFFAMAPAFGHAGGGEQLADSVLRACEQNWSKTSPDAVALTPRAKSQIMDHIKRRRVCWGPGSTTAPAVETFEFNDSKGMGAGVIKLKKNVIDACWRTAHRPLLRIVQKNLRSLRDQYRKERDRGTTVRPLVVVAGGSLTNAVLLEQVKELIDACDLGPALIVNKEGIAHHAVRNAIGALYALRKAMTVRQFLNEGAAIALQTKQARNKEWTSHATPVYYYHKANETEMHPLCEVAVLAGDRVRLTCDPFYGQDCVDPGEPTSGEPITDIFYTRTYDFLDAMPEAPFSGLYTCKVRFEDEEDDEVKMHLEVIMTPVDDVYEVVTRKFEIPVYFDYGTRSMLAGRRSESLKEVVPALFADADGNVKISD
ncbi:hypothetical protein QBC32DRAFT_317628 [Pseudoneurospora amorphoporcata]|uniref:Uncharacterized protein n=1 Tax=Pseudoneurospora amorphoporcata TaxID=241081 RepID=A0AAN6SCJ8_9PEZI|nr:hypothetical protein QBC32DRAFT_317628 [Pseudoneurospora amorphoporcata]